MLRHALGLAVAGVVLGSSSPFAWARLLRSLLFGIGPSDPFTFVAVSSLLLLVAFVASYVPARRAASVDPAHALRWE